MWYYDITHKNIVIIIKRITMKLQQLYSYTRQGIDDFELIDDGDKIAIGVSGGKDSLALLYALSGLKRFYPKKFDIAAIAVNLGYDTFDLTDISELCCSLDIPFYEVKTDIAQIVFEERKEKNPCSLCSKMRKGALANEALRLECNKIAYAHHKDDFIETAMLSLLYEGHFYTFPPKIHLDKTNLTLIRPFIYLEERDVIGFKNKYNLPVQKNPCPADGFTKREYVKNLLHNINHENPGAKNRIFNAILESYNN